MLYEAAKPNDNRADLVHSLKLRFWPMVFLLIVFAALRGVAGLPVPWGFYPVGGAWCLVLLGTIALIPKVRSTLAFNRLHFAFYLLETVPLGALAWLNGGAEWIGFSGFFFVVLYANFLLPQPRGLV